MNLKSNTNYAEYCESAKKYVERNGEYITDKNGDCTWLYWHISTCEKCAELENKKLGIEI